VVIYWEISGGKFFLEKGDNDFQKYISKYFLLVFELMGICI